MAEVYWDLEWSLQQQGFNYTYDKRLYDRLEHGPARPVHDHFLAGLDYQDKMARFLENHDEPRAAATFLPGQYEAAAVITFLAPGLRFFHQGQFEGKKKRISPHLVRGPDEAATPQLGQFYDRLLTILRRSVVRDGRWQLLQSRPAWEKNTSCDDFVAFAWTAHNDEKLLVMVNYSAHQSQCYAQLPFADLGGRSWRLQDQLSAATYEREGQDLIARGLYLDVAPWTSHVFAMAPITS